MNLTSRHALRNDVMAAEGFRDKPYFDCCGKPYRSCICPPQKKGKLTIGYGRNLDDVGLSKLEAEVLLEHDLHSAEQTANRMFDWFGALSELRQRAITELIFNMVAVTVRGFRQMLLAIKVKQYTAAAAHLLDSKWRTQVGPTRSGRIARYLGDGG
jgi:lysozyme